MSRRGVLVSADLEVDRYKNHIRLNGHGTEFFQHLRRWCLLWDAIAVPRHHGMLNSLPPDMEYLENCGFLEHVDVQVSGGEGAKIINDAFALSMNKLEAAEPGSWAIDCSPGSIFFPDHKVFPLDQIIENRGILVNLHNVIPVPDREVPLEEVLNFKYNRRSELLALRHKIDNLYTSFQSSPDEQHAVLSACEQIESGASDVLRILRESRMPFRMCSTSISVNLIGFAYSGVALLFSQDVILTDLANVLASTISASPTFGWRSRMQNAREFQYVASYHEYLFGE